jgi:hypothetical protein
MFCCLVYTHVVWFKLINIVALTAEFVKLILLVVFMQQDANNKNTEVEHCKYYKINDKT